MSDPDFELPPSEFIVALERLPDGTVRISTRDFRFDDILEQDGTALQILGDHGKVHARAKVSDGNIRLLCRVADRTW